MTSRMRNRMTNRMLNTGETTVRLLLVACTAFVPLVAGCGKDSGSKVTGTDDDGGGTTPTYTEDVQPILERSCSCHQPGGVKYSTAPLDTYENASARRSLIRQRVWVDRSMPQGGSLPESDRATIRDWVDGGAPR